MQCEWMGCCFNVLTIFFEAILQGTHFLNMVTYAPVRRHPLNSRDNITYNMRFVANRANAIGVWIVNETSRRWIVVVAAVSLQMMAKWGKIAALILANNRFQMQS